MPTKRPPRAAPADVDLTAAIWDGPDLVSIHRRDATILAVNAAFAAFTGHAADDLVGSDYYRLVHPDDRLHLSTEHRRHLRREGRPVRHRIEGATGDWREIETMPHLLPDARFFAVARPVPIPPQPVGPATSTDRPSATDVLSLVFEMASTGKAIIDRDRRIVEANSALCRMLAWPRDRLVGLRLGDLVDAADLGRVLSSVRGLSPSGQAINDSIRIRTSAGTELVCDLAIAPLDGPRPRRFLVEVMDISRGVLTDRGAFGDDRRLFAVLGASQEAVLILDATDHVVEMNDSAVRLFGWQREEALGRSLDELELWVDAARRARLRNLAHRVAALAGFDAQLRARDGTTRDVVLSAQQLTFHGVPALLVRASDVTERRRSEGLLAESEERFRALATRAPVGIFQTDADGACRYVNPRWTELSGLGPEQAQGNGWLAAIHPDDLDRVGTAWQAASDGIHPFAMDYRFRRPDGTVRWVAGSASPIIGPGLTVAGYIGTVEDITDRIRAQAALRDSESRFRRLFEDLPVGAALHDASGAIVAANRSAVRLLESATAAQLFDVTGRRVPPKRHPAALAARTGHAVSDQVYGLRLPDGRQRWLLVTAVPWEREGEPLLVLVSYLDLTQRLEAEQAIARQADLLDLASDAIIVRDHRDRIEYWSRGATTIFGWTADEASGRVAHELLQAEYPIPLRDVTRKLARDGTWEGEVVHVAKGGRRILSLSRQAGRRGAGRRIAQVLEINRDITARTIAQQATSREEALAAALRERERLGREIHDGLAQRLWYAQLRQAALLARPDLSATQRGIAMDAATAIEQALADARTAVLASRAPDPIASSFEEVLRGVIEDRIGPHPLEAHFEFGSIRELPSRQQAELIGIAQEALNNVVKHAEAAQVIVRVESTDRGTTMSIRDDGRGFRRADVRHGDGSGFGLGSMRQRAALIDGRMRLTSAPGRGTTVRVSVPAPPDSPTRGGRGGS